MAAAAETRTRQIEESWLLATDAFPDAERQARLEQQVFLGKLAVRHEVHTAAETDNTDTLMGAIWLAADGDEQSKRVVCNNVAADVGERLYKAGRKTTVAMRFVDGKLEQDGRQVTNVHHHTFEHTELIPEMHRRAASELKSVLLFEKLQPTGILETHDVYIFSTSSTKMTAQQKADYHLFADTETCSIQRLACDGDEVELETAFVAGKATPISPRHDIKVIKKLAAEGGVAIRTDDGTDMLEYVMLVPKTDNPDGIVDMVRRFDDRAGGTFYGEAKPRQDYLAHARACEAQTQAFDDIVDAITAQLISEAVAFDSPLEAILRLDELSERFCVKHAINHHEINVAIFGATAAMHIEEARFFIERGEYDRAERSTTKAYLTADTGSCPLFKGNRSRSDNDTSDDTKSSTESSGKKWMKCPHCTARVFDDPCAKVLSCWDCKARVVNGHIESTGNGGSRARLTEAAKRRAREQESESRLVLSAK